MAVTEIDWGDGSGGKIYLTYSSASGNQEVVVTSDANTGAARSKTVTFTSGVGSITRQLTVNQVAGGIVPIYELASPCTTANYDTGVTLFDTPKSFTILCQASWNNRNWANTANNSKNGLFGILDGSYNNMFKMGGIYQGYPYVDGVRTNTGNKYTAIVMNPATSGKMCSSIVARAADTSVLTESKLWVRYNATTRLVEAGVGVTPTDRYFTVSGDLTSSNTLRLCLNSNSSRTIEVFKVYDTALSDELIDAFMTE